MIANDKTADTLRERERESSNLINVKNNINKTRLDLI